MENPIDGTDEKLGRGFMSADKLEDIKIASLGIIRRCLVWIVPLLSIGCQSSLVLNLTSNLPEKSTSMKYWPT
jgi:hypothetical protein